MFQSPSPDSPLAVGGVDTNTSSYTNLCIRASLRSASLNLLTISLLSLGEGVSRSERNVFNSFTL